MDSPDKPCHQSHINRTFCKVKMVHHHRLIPRLFSNSNWFMNHKEQSLARACMKLINVVKNMIKYVWYNRWEYSNVIMGHAGHDMNEYTNTYISYSLFMHPEKCIAIVLLRLKRKLQMICKWIDFIIDEFIIAKPHLFRQLLSHHHLLVMSFLL